MSDTSQGFAERFAALPDEDLIKVVTVDAGDYVEEARQAARSELDKRGVKQIPAEKVAALQKEKTTVGPGWWLRGYCVLTGADVAFGAYYVLLTVADGFYLMAAFRLLFALLEIATLVGLWQRRLWGWRLNWVMLALVVFLVGIPTSQTTVGSAIGVGVIALIWGLPNFLFFKRRRHLFT